MIRIFSIRLYIIIFLFCFISNNLFGQIETDFSGYIVNLPIYQTNNKTLANTFGFDKSQFLNLTRLRLRPAFYLWDNARINVEYEITSLYFNSVNSFLLDTPQKSSRQLINLTWTPVNKDKFKITHFIDRLSFRQGFDWGNIEIGRQRVQWGSGRIWNPTDLFNPINPATFYKNEKDGADIISLKYVLGNFTDLDLVFNANEKLINSNYGFRFRTNYYEFDISFMGGRFDKRIVGGIDLAGNLYDAGVRFEGIFSSDEIDLKKNFVKYIFGTDYQFTSKLYSVIEYHYNGEGEKDKSAYQLLYLFNGRIINLSKNYLYEGITYQYHPLFTLSFSNNTNLNDGSGYFALIGSYSVSEDIYLNAGIQIVYGNDFTEYWYYSNSFYLQAEYYF